MIDLFKIKEDFSFLVKEAEPWTLTQFVMWLDLKLSEFKTKGYMILDHNVKTKPKWLEDETFSSDVAPAPAPCRNCHSSKSSTRDVGQYFSDIHAPPPIHQSSGSRTLQDPAHRLSEDDSEKIRGDVGIIDLSHGELQNTTKNNYRQNTNQNRVVSPGGNYTQGVQQGYPRQSSLSNTATSVTMAGKRSRLEVIEIDGSSPTDKMFQTGNRSEIGRTSTPIVRRAGQLLQKAKNRQFLSTGSAIYTSTTSTLTPTFSSSLTTPSTRSVPSNRNYALGAPPVSSFGTAAVGSSFTASVESQIQALDDIIAQTVQSVSGQNRISTEIPQTNQQSDINSVQRQSSFKDTNNPAETVFPRMSISHSAFSQMSDGQAVPVALHANIDNINREMSASHGSGSGSADGTEVKMETENNTSIGDSFTADVSTMQSSVLDTSSDTSHSQSYQDTSQSGPSQVGPGEVPRPGLVDPETALAYQMVELVTGSGVYVYDKTISQAFKVGTERDTGTYSGEKMARYLLNVFWSRKDLVGATLSKAGRGKKILNQQIIEAILDFCSFHGRHKRSKVKTALHWSVSARTCQAKRKSMQLAQNFTV